MENSLHHDNFFSIVDPRQKSGAKNEIHDLPYFFHLSPHLQLAPPPLFTPQKKNLRENEKVKNL